jgi:hypothetical protein
MTMNRDTWWEDVARQVLRPPAPAPRTRGLPPIELPHSMASLRARTAALERDEPLGYTNPLRAAEWQAMRGGAARIFGRSGTGSGR